MFFFFVPYCAHLDGSMCRRRFVKIRLYRSIKKQNIYNTLSFKLVREGDNRSYTKDSTADMRSSTYKRKLAQLITDLWSFALNR